MMVYFKKSWSNFFGNYDLWLKLENFSVLFLSLKYQKIKIYFFCKCKFFYLEYFSETIKFLYGTIIYFVVNKVIY